jgi:hypothetical protein
VEEVAADHQKFDLMDKELYPSDDKMINDEFAVDSEMVGLDFGPVDSQHRV